MLEAAFSLRAPYVSTGCNRSGLLSFRGLGSDFLGQVILESDEFYPKLSCTAEIRASATPSGAATAIIVLQIPFQTSDMKTLAGSRPPCSQQITRLLAHHNSEEFITCR